MSSPGRWRGGCVTCGPAPRGVSTTSPGSSPGMALRQPGRSTPAGGRGPCTPSPPEGRRALRRWVAEPGAGPVLEYEALLKVAFAARGTKADLLGHLDSIGGHAAARLATGRTRAEEYANALVPLPEHLAVNGLMWSFLWQLYSAVEDWAAWATAEVTRWPDDLRPAADADARAVGRFRAALDTTRGRQR